MDIIGDLRQAEDTFLLVSGVPNVTLWEQVDGSLEKVGTNMNYASKVQDNQSIASFWPEKKQVVCGDS